MLIHEYQISYTFGDLLKVPRMCSSLYLQLNEPPANYRRSRFQLQSVHANWV